jgi:hypothetical protein
MEVRLDLRGLVADEKQTVEASISGLPRPLICLHTKGNTTPQGKDRGDKEAPELQRRLLAGMPGTLIVLDRDGRVVMVDHPRVSRAGRPSLLERSY